MRTGSEYKRRIEKFNPRLNAFVDLGEGDLGDGPSYGVKSNISVSGLPLTAGIEAYRDNIAPRDATVVERIKSSGGSVLGTLNMHEAALGATTDNLAYGRTHNPWRYGFTPGGSSGGSGAAVAAGLCDVALGSDTMGSIRIPAAYCGVQGHKPTTGVVPNDGVLALSHSLDHVGPLARDVYALWQSMHVLADWGKPGELIPSQLNQLRVGFWDGDSEIALTDPVSEAFERFIGLLASEAGLEPEKVAPPEYAYGKSRRAGLLISEVEAFSVHKEQLQSNPEGFTPSFRSLLEWGVGRPPDDVSTAYKHIERVRAAADALFQEVDVVIAPTAPQQAFSFDDRVPANQADFTAWANFAALPATAVCTGIDAQTLLPHSVQVIGPYGADRLTLEVAAAIETLCGKPPMPPGFE
ncbi:MULTISPECIES: amidase [Hyphomonas]|uniref:amidase n=1 Tax=Hyphomonas TaxID=85 RepID=UPI003512265E